MATLRLSRETKSEKLLICSPILNCNSSEGYWVFDKKQQSLIDIFLPKNITKVTGINSHGLASSSVLGDYSLGGHSHYQEKWRPLRPQISAS